MKELETKSMEKIKKVFVKSSNLFKKKAILTYDGYILDVNTDLSNESYLGIYVIKIDDDVNDLIHQLYEDNYTMMEITPQKTKTDFSIYKIIIDDGKTSYYDMLDKKDKLISLYNIYKNSDETQWAQLCDAIDYNDVFKDNKAVEISSTNSYSGNVIISKTILPNITKNVFNKVRYKTEKYSDMLNALTINFHIDSSDILMHYYYL